MRLASKGGPPAVNANTEMATKLGVAPMMRMCPAPRRQIRLACSAVRHPAMINAANTAQER